MLTIWLFYKAFVRRIYKRKSRGWNKAASDASFALLGIQIVSITLISEVLFRYKGIWTFFGTHHAPWGPISGGLFVIIAALLYKFMPYKKHPRQIKQLRRVIVLANGIPKKVIWFIIIISYALFFISIFIISRRLLE